MIKVLTKDIYRHAFEDGHRGGPALFMEKLIKSCRKQKIAEFTFDPRDTYDAVLDGTIDLRRTFSLDDVIGFKNCGKPFVLRLSGLGHPKYQERYIRENCEIMSIASHIIYQTQYCREAWVGACADSSAAQAPHTIIMNGDDPKRFEVEPMFKNLPGVTFAAVASWGPRKKLDFILDLFKLLIKQGADVSLLLAGRFKDGVAPTPVEDEYKGRILFCGYVDQSNIPSFYKSANAFIHAKAGDWCPNTVVEALCAGLPGVVHSHGGTIELLGGAGVTFRSHDPEKAARSVIKLTENYWRYKKRANARRTVLDIDHVAQQYIDVVRSYR